MDHSSFKPIINLSLETIVKECSINPHYADTYFSDFALINRENVHQVFRYKKFNDDFTDFLTCYDDGNYFLGIIRPCYNEFLYKLHLILNIKPDSNMKDDETLTKKLTTRLQVLEKIRTEQELKHEFPLLYKDLTAGRSYIKSIETLSKNNDSYKKQKDYYYSCALKKRLDRFITTQVELYKRFINLRALYKDKIENTSYNSYIRNRFDLNKIAMYAAHECLRICESANDSDVIIFYLSYLDKYISSPYKKDVTLNIKDNIKIEYKSILTRIKNVRRSLDNSSSVNWVLLPKGKNIIKQHYQKKNLPKK